MIERGCSQRQVRWLETWPTASEAHDPGKGLGVLAAAPRYDRARAGALLPDGWLALEFGQTRHCAKDLLDD